MYNVIENLKGNLEIEKECIEDAKRGIKVSEKRILIDNKAISESIDKVRAMEEAIKILSKLK